MATAPAPTLGNTTAILAGVCWALTLMGLTHLEQSGEAGASPGIDAAFAGNALAFGVALPFALPLTQVSAADLAGVTYLGVVQTAVAYLVMVRGMRELPALETSLLLLIEPVLTPFWTWWLHGETVTALAAAGCALVLAATAGRALGSARAG